MHYRAWLSQITEVIEMLNGQSKKVAKDNLLTVVGDEVTDCFCVSILV